MIGLNMNSISIFSKLEILLYSALTSLMSGIGHLKSRAQHLAIPPFLPRHSADQAPDSLNNHIAARTVSIRWDVIQQALLALLLWTVLGFAAGFLIGMIRPG